MPLRPHWGRAGASLMAISIAGAIAEVTGLTTTTRSSVPIWPLYVCAALFVIGALLFLARGRDTSAPTQPRANNSLAMAQSALGHQPSSYPNRTFSDVGPEEILELFKGRTEIQGEMLARPHIGKWLRVSGKLDSVDPWDNLTKSSTVTLKDFQVSTGGLLLFGFSDQETVESRLAILGVGTAVTIVGKIDSVSSNFIGLEDCELESVRSQSIL